MPPGTDGGAPSRKGRRSPDLRRPKRAGSITEPAPRLVERISEISPAHPDVIQDPGEHRNGRLSFSSLELADVGPMDACTGCESLLRETSSEAVLPEDTANVGRMGERAHGVQIAARGPSYLQTIPLESNRYLFVQVERFLSPPDTEVPPAARSPRAGPAGAGYPDGEKPASAENDVWPRSV